MDWVLKIYGRIEYTRCVNEFKMFKSFGVRFIVCLHVMTSHLDVCLCVTHAASKLATFF